MRLEIQPPIEAIGGDRYFFKLPDWMTEVVIQMFYIGVYEIASELYQEDSKSTKRDGFFISD